MARRIQTQVTDRVAAFVTGLKPEDLPQAVLDAAKLHILDTVACVLAGAPEPLGAVIMNWIQAEGSAGRSRLLIGGQRVSATQSAWVHGTLAHVLDYDDVTEPWRVHASSTAFAAALAAAELAERDGLGMLAAYVAGVETTIAMAKLVGREHYRAGWHTTATAGAVGAAAAAAFALRLDAGQTRNALGLAVTRASGSRCSFGTMAKALHVGYAARIGVEAAALAARGCTACESAIEAPMGFLDLFRPGAEGDAGDEAVTATLGTSFALIDPGLGIKIYPCCRATHRAIDGILAVASCAGLAWREVEHIDVELPPGGLDPLSPDPPRSGIEAKFSLNHALAVAFIDRRVTFASFTDEAVARPETGKLAARVHAQEVADCGSQGCNGFVRVSLTATDGRRWSHRVTEARGGARTPLSWDEVVQKLRDCISRSGCTLDAGRIAERTRALDGCPQAADWIAAFNS